jgi:methylmalonyl-CoA mutase
MTSIQPLAGGFPSFSESDWRAAVASARRATAEDAGPESRGGDLLAPRARGARAIVGRPPGQTWQIVERIDSGDAESAARTAAEAVAGGATGLDLVLPSSLHPITRRLNADAGAIAAALRTVATEGVQLRVDAGAPGPEILDTFLDLAAARGCELVWAFDSAAAFALGGATADDVAATVRDAASAFARRGVDGTVAVADGRLWHAGGATEEQELGAALATYANLVRLLGSTDRIGVALAADTDQFRGIAKFRAMRLLVARIVEVADLPSPTLRIHAETSWRSLSARDLETNILRGASATFAAIAGGADSICVLPFDAIQGDEAAGRRLARHTQIILAEEAHLGRVADPGAGSGAIEATTATFAEAAWKRFQSIEAEGGIMSAIAEGSLLRDVAEAREARLARVARGNIRLIGVNAFRGEATTATVKRAPVKRTGPLTFKRLSEPFEAAS